MRKFYILEKIFTGAKVKFLEGTIEGGQKDGNKVVVLHDLDKNAKFIIAASLYNFVRFKRWIGHEAMADYEPHFKSFNTNFGRLKVITLSTEVEVDTYKEKRIGGYSFDDLESFEF